MIASQKKLLFLGGGYADIPLIKAAKALGFYVITTGNRAEDLGHRYSDEFHQEDYSDEHAMLRLAETLEVEAVCACCNDFSALSAAYVAEKLGLPGHDSFETAKIIHHKDRYRQFALKHQFPSPRAQGFADVENAMEALDGFRFPLLVKPVDLTGGKGISRLEGADMARPALEHAFRVSHVKRVVLEEFIEGTRHGLSTFVRDGKVVFHFSDNEHYYKNPYLVSAASTPGNVSARTVDTLCASIERLVSLLSLKTGIVHMQYILRGEEPIIIEICRRAPGDLYVRLVEHATGVDYSSYIVRAAAGLECGSLNQVGPQGYFTRHCVMAAHAGEIQSLSFDPLIQGKVIDEVMWWKKGDRVDDVLLQKLGIVFLRFDSLAEMLRETERLPELVRLELAPAQPCP